MPCKKLVMSDYNITLVSGNNKGILYLCTINQKRYEGKTKTLITTSTFNLTSHKSQFMKSST